MTARASITAAAMREAIAAAQKGLRVELKPDGTLIIEPAGTLRDVSDEAQPIDLVTWKKPGR